MKEKKQRVDKFLLAIVFLSLLVLGGGVIFASKIGGKPEVAPNKEVKAQVSETNYSWGEIPIDGGNVKKNFPIKNAGQDILKVFNVKTSCMCTTTRVLIQEQLSPPFGMHSQSPWVGKIAPGEEAQLEIVFDPAYHGPSGLGPITREILLETNDPANSKLIFTLTGTVVK